MQLESTLFGVLVVQVKPQLELVLNLPPDTLTKEVALTQDIMNRESRLWSSEFSYSAPHALVGAFTSVHAVSSAD